MKTMHKLGLTVLVLTVGMLFIASPANAGKKGDATSRLEFQLTPPATGAPEPDASGTCAVTHYQNMVFLLRVTVKCTGLTPGTTYVAAFGTGETHALTADARGRLNASFPVTDFITSFFGLWIVNASDELVLEGHR